MSDIQTEMVSIGSKEIGGLEKNLIGIPAAIYELSLEDFE